MKWIVAGIGALAVVVGILIVAARDPTGGETADVSGQGGEGPAIAVDGASLERAADGLRMRVVVPTPEPGSYEYPTGDMIPPWIPSHPEVEVGSPSEPEVFTLWAFVFNYPERCSNNSCGVDDLDADAPARGGVYQPDGRVADDDELVLAGGVRLGQEPLLGSPMENPLGAEVHLAIAPHGKALPGVDGWRQLNSPIGNPTLWWLALFAPPED